MKTRLDLADRRSVLAVGGYLGLGLALIGLLLGGAGCATVRPEQRAVLADPTMQFDNDPGDGAARDHVLENREGSSGGTSVKGGGCGCN
jgi:hypothetical protein